MGNLALKIFTENIKGNSMTMHEESSIFLVKRNSGSISGWKRVIAAIVFNQTGHELRMRQDWEDEKNSVTNFPKYKTFFILKKGEEESPRGQSGEPVKDDCKVQSNDGSNSVLFLQGARRGSESVAECRKSRWRRKSKGGKETTDGKSSEAQIPGEGTSQEESKQRRSDYTRAGLPVGMGDSAALDPPGTAQGVQG